jgi:hypothetical protein
MLSIKSVVLCLNVLSVSIVYAGDVSYWVENNITCKSIYVKNNSRTTSYRVWIRYSNTRNTFPQSDGTEEGGWILVPGSNSVNQVCPRDNSQGMTFNYYVRWEPYP